MQTRTGSERYDIDLVFFVRLLHPSGLNIFQDHRHKVLRLTGAEFFIHDTIEQFVVLIDGKNAVWGEASTMKGPATLTVFLSS